MKFLGGNAESSPWVTVSEAVSEARGKVWAAVAYIGVDGHTALPLKQGDLLVCDCSKQAVRNGSTQLSGVKDFVDAGCSVYSVEGLHAKVVVLPKRAFVGSMNASESSRNRRIEAAFVATDAQVVAEARRFVKDLASDAARVDADFLQKAKAWQTSKPPRPEPEVRQAEVPSDLAGCQIVWLVREDWSDDEESSFDAGVETAKHETPFSFHRGHFSWPKNDLGNFPLNTWVVQVIDGVAHPPAQVVHKSSFNRSGTVHLATPKGLEKIDAEDVEAICGSEPDGFVATCSSSKGKQLRALFGKPSRNGV